MKYTDYELYKLLDENGYEPSLVNLALLKEGLEKGEMNFFEEVNLSDYELYKLLDENGYEPTNENLNLLKEGIKAGSIKIEK